MDKTIPIASSVISAGFPSPSEDLILDRLDLNEFLITHPASTFFLRVGGDSMINAGIFDNDILIVDRSLDAKSGQIIIADVGGELTVKRYILVGGKVKLQPENDKYKPIIITDLNEFKIWGIVVSVIHKY